MTAQRSDTILFTGDEYSLIGWIGGPLASPAQFGMETEMMSTACYRGFYATYELTEEALYLRELTLSLSRLREIYDDGSVAEEKDYLPIGGIEPAKEKHQATYHGLSEVIPFTGKIRLAKNFIAEFDMEREGGSPIAFKTVLDITLKDGRIVESKDRSQELKQQRGAYMKSHDRWSMLQTINKAFRLDMDSETGGTSPQKKAWWQIWKL